MVQIAGGRQLRPFSGSHASPSPTGFAQMPVWLALPPEQVLSPMQTVLVPPPQTSPPFAMVTCWHEPARRLLHTKPCTRSQSAENRPRQAPPAPSLAAHVPPAVQ